MQTAALYQRHQQQQQQNLKCQEKLSFFAWTKLWCVFRTTGQKWFLETWIHTNGMLLLSVKGWETWCHKTQVRWQGVQFCTNWSRFDSHDNSMMLGVFEFLFVIRYVQDTLQFCWSVLKVYGSFSHHLVCGCELCSQPQSFVYFANPAHQSTITFFRWYLKTRFVLWAWDGLWNCKMVAIWRMETRQDQSTGRLLLVQACIRASSWAC